MADYPALPLFTDAYLADTMHLDVVESGAYLHLLMIAWRMPDCALPDDDAKLARWARCTPKQWARVRPSVMAFWRLDEIDGLPKWSQKRLLKERSWVEEKRKKASTAAKAKALKERMAAHADASPEHTTKHPPEHSVRSAPYPTPYTLPKGKAASAAPLDDLDAILYARGKALLGNSAGGLLTTLKQARGTGQALEDLEAASRKQDPREYIAGLIKSASASQDEKPAEHPTWRWEHEDWIRAIARFRKSGAWSRNWGPTPDEPGCLMPEEVRGQNPTKGRAGSKSQGFEAGLTEAEWRKQADRLETLDAWRQRPELGPPPGEPGCRCPDTIAREWLLRLPEGMQRRRSEGDTADAFD